MGTVSEAVPTPKTDLDQVGDFLRELLREGRDDEVVTLVLDLLKALRDKNTELELRVRKLLRERYARKSEGVSSDQLSLLLNHLDSKKPDDATEEAKEFLEKHDAEEDDKETDKPKKKGSRGRRPLPPNIERIPHEHPVEGDARICSRCGKEKTPIGHETTSVLEFVPAKFQVHEHRREKLACKSCGDGVVVADAPAKLIDNGRPGPGLLAEILVNKYRDSLPLNRQSHRFARLGVELPRSTLCDWVGVGAGELSPIAALLAARTLVAEVLKTDGTGIDVLDRTRAGNKKRGMLYAHVGDGADMFFAYVGNESKDEPQKILAGRKGPLVADAASIYDGVFDAPGSEAIEYGCWMHARRPFKAALDAGDSRAAIALSFIKKLYKVERKATLARAGPAKRKRMRQKLSKPIAEELGKWMRALYPHEPPKTPLHKGLVYGLNQWTALNRYLDDGRAPIDNGEVERVIRVVAVGRHNYLFAGSDAGGERAAVMYTILGSCALAGVDPWAYTRDVLEKLAGGWKASRLEELLPAAWLKQHPQAAVPRPRPAALTD